jgi:predicted lipoprotein with Yx(FWY)xxD motif
MVNYKALSTVFVVLTVVFGATTGYLLTTPSASTNAGAGGNGSPPSVSITYKPGVGFYLVNATGFTIYLRTSDVHSNGTSTCTGGCIKAWPAFYASTLTVSAGLNASSFKPVTRADGIKQLAYDGWPLYYYVNDAKAGDTTGQGLGSVWFACCSVPSNSTTT